MSNTLFQTLWFSEEIYNFRLVINGKTTQFLADKPNLPLTTLSSLIGSTDVDTNSMALFLENMNQGCKLQREELCC